MNRWARILRTAPAQLALFGATYLGAVGLAGTALCLRGYWFEPRVNEKFTPMTDPNARPLTFEQAVDGLEKIVKQLEEGKITQQS